MSSHSTKRISKFLSLVLRHKPEQIGLHLDPQGWADVPELLQRAAAHGIPIDLPTLTAVVRDNEKQRFAFSEDNRRIRANQGHSISIELGLEPLTPPATLYHGTATRFLDSIREQGLQKRSRQHVHLSSDTETAVKVGKRHGKPVILQVRAGAMHDAGMAFFRSQNGVWLTAHVPTDYLIFPEE